MFPVKLPDGMYQRFVLGEMNVPSISFPIEPIGLENTISLSWPKKLPSGNFWLTVGRAVNYDIGLASDVVA